jgi:lipopolysaccharide/colanic/teichoic acid biosynthesis glycosyltransferase
LALTIKIDSKGPVFFRQERLGRNGKVFKIVKFRTMIKNAESVGTGVYTSNNDNRVTKVGKFLRGASLDELPQLFNILFGSMSIVGPRPPVKYHPYLYEDYPERFKDRFSMRPGITGYAQVIGRNTLTWSERFEYDLIYIQKFNLILDLKIIFKTFMVFNNKKEIFDTENKRERKDRDVKR